MPIAWLVPFVPLPLRHDRNELTPVEQRDDFDHGAAVASFNFVNMGSNAAVHLA